MFWLVLQTFLLVLVAVAIGIVIGGFLRSWLIVRPTPALAGIPATAVPPTTAERTATGGAAATGTQHPASADAEPVAVAEPAPDPVVVAEPAPVPGPEPVVAEPAPAESEPVSLAEPAPQPEPVSTVAASEPAAVRADPLDAGSPADGIIDAGKAAAADQVGVRPPVLTRARDGAPDDLKRIKGIGPQNEARLNALGVYHFFQIADWSPDEARWVGTYLAFPGRIEREDWVGQAKLLAAPGA